jgi:hypothetical protein
MDMENLTATKTLSRMFKKATSAPAESDEAKRTRCGTLSF